MNPSGSQGAGFPKPKSDPAIRKSLCQDLCTELPSEVAFGPALAGCSSRRTSSTCSCVRLLAAAGSPRRESAAGFRISLSQLPVLGLRRLSRNPACPGNVVSSPWLCAFGERMARPRGQHASWQAVGIRRRNLFGPSLRPVAERTRSGAASLPPNRKPGERCDAPLALSDLFASTLD